MPVYSSSVVNSCTMIVLKVRPDGDSNDGQSNTIFRPGASPEEVPWRGRRPV
jgi:hypothetical protein